MLSLDLPPDLAAQLRDSVDRNERVIWSGRPIPRRLAVKGIPMALFGIPFGGFALFWTAMASRGVSNSAASDGWLPYLFPLFGVPFILVGLGLLTQPWRIVRQARRTIYALTERRALIIKCGRSTSVKSFGIDQLQQIESVRHADGSGDVIFAAAAPVYIPGQTEMPTVGLKNGFIGVPNVKAVEEHVKAMAARSSAGHSM